MTIPVNPGPDFPGPTPPVPPLDQPNPTPDEPDPDRLPDDKPEPNPDLPSIGDVLRDLSCTGRSTGRSAVASTRLSVVGTYRPA